MKVFRALGLFSIFAISGCYLPNPDPPHKESTPIDQRFLPINDTSPVALDSKTGLTCKTANVQLEESSPYYGAPLCVKLYSEEDAIVKEVLMKAVNPGRPMFNGKVESADDLMKKYGLESPPDSRPSSPRPMKPQSNK